MVVGCYASVDGHSAITSKKAQYRSVLDERQRTDPSIYSHS